MIASLTGNLTGSLTAADLDHFTATAMRLLWRSSWQASVLTGIVLLVQVALRQRLSARWRHALWGIVLLRLLVPVTPPTRWSLFNVALLVPTSPSHVIILANAIRLPIVTSPQSPQSPPPTYPWQTILAATWLIGLAWMLARIVWASTVLYIAVRRMPRMTDA